jgi:hypothetical protein
VLVGTPYQHLRAGLGRELNSRHGERDLNDFIGAVRVRRSGRMQQAGHNIRRQQGRAPALHRVESNQPLAFGNRPALLLVLGWAGIQGVMRLASASSWARTTARKHGPQAVDSDRNTRLA